MTMRRIQSVDAIFLDVLLTWGKTNMVGNKLWIKRLRRLKNANSKDDLATATQSISRMLTPAQRQSIIYHIGNLVEQADCLPGQEALQRQVVNQLRGNRARLH